MTLLSGATFGFQQAARVSWCVCFGEISLAAVIVASRSVKPRFIVVRCKQAYHRCPLVERPERKKLRQFSLEPFSDALVAVNTMTTAKPEYCHAKCRALGGVRSPATIISAFILDSSALASKINRRASSSLRSDNPPTSFFSADNLRRLAALRCAF